MITDLDKITCKQCLFSFFNKKGTSYMQACDCDRVFFNVLNYNYDKRIVINIENIFFTLKLKENIEIVCELETKFGKNYLECDLIKVSLLNEYISEVKNTKYLSELFNLLENKLNIISQNLIFI